MARRLLAWFRDEDGNWNGPEGRRGELVALVLCLPALSVLVHFEAGLPRPTEHWPVVLVGVWGGFLYARSYRTVVLEAVPDWLPIGQVFSLLAGGLGLSPLRLVHTVDPTISFLLAAGGTVLSIYLVRVASPLHPGLEPPRRGVEPPPAAETERRSRSGTETNATADR